MSDRKDHPGIWQAEVRSRSGELESRLAAVRAGDGSLAMAPGEAAIATSVEGLVKAGRAATEGDKLPSRLKAWWTGSSITEAWESVHNAELALLEIEKRSAVRATLPRLLAWINNVMEEGKQRELHAEALEGQIGDREKFDRVQVRGALTDVIAANSTRYGNLRVFRNVLIVVTALLLLLVFAVAGWHALNPDFLTLCPAGAKACVSTPPETTEVALVALLGAIGGSLALAFGLVETASPPSRYDPKIWQAFLKPVTGAITGILGVMLVQAEFLLQPTGNQSYALLVYAVIFGFSQQLFTRTVDRKAEALASAETAAKK